MLLPPKLRLMSKHILLLGATGTIGRATAVALIEDGHEVTCIVRNEAQIDGCDVKIGDVADMGLDAGIFDTVISCIASRTGAPKDAWAVEHDLHCAILEQAIEAKIGQFILLSAICVQKPILDFQKAKLAFEAKLRSSGLSWSIVRPTAYFKSLSGQIGRLKEGKPFLLFGDGKLTACKPISDGDLGRFITRCVSEPTKHNRILPIGGPGPAVTPKDQGMALFEALGAMPKFRQVPVAVISTIIAVLGQLGKISPRLAEKAELAKIGRYYATESMLVWDEKAGRYDAEATPEFGTDRLDTYYEKVLKGDLKDDRGDHAVF